MSMGRGPGLQGKIAIITGGARGIGAATAAVFIREGAQVAIASRNIPELTEAASRLGPSCFAVPTDVSDEKSVKNLFSETIKKFGRVDILVNNAGIASLHHKFSDLSTEAWDQVLNVNLRGCFFCCREGFSKMSKGGSIVNISSLAGISGPEKFFGFTAYSVSKYGVTGLTESLALEAQQNGLRINCIAPGAVDTAMLRTNLPKLRTEAKPVDIAEIILSVCEDRSRALNGAVIPVFTKAWME